MEHPCPNCSHPIGEQLFDAAMKATCPNCYVALTLVRNAQTWPGLTSQDKAFLNVVGSIAIGVFIGKLLFG